MMLRRHPAEQGFCGLLSILLILVVLFGVPIFFVILIIYKVATRKRDEFQTGITKQD